jgi:hypothetical protein
VWENNEPVKRVVETGLDNNRMMRITSGLKDGEEVMMAPPLPESMLEDTGPSEFSKEDIDRAKQSNGDDDGDQGPQRSTEAPAQRQGGGGPGGGGGGGMLANLDANGDGKISKSEAPERMQGRFGELDQNGDGFLSGSEIPTFGGGGRGGPGGGGGDGGGGRGGPGGGGGGFGGGGGGGGGGRGQ